MAHDVFISYSSDDKTAADAVCATLEAEGIRCWIAPRDILAGMDWASSLIEAIASSQVVVLVFSSRANASKQVEREIERAVHKAIPIIPVRLEDVAPSSSLEYFISTQHWLDAITPPLEKHLHELAGKIKALLARSVDPEVRARGMLASLTAIGKPASFRFVKPTLIAVGLAIAALSGWMVFRRGASPPAIDFPNADIAESLERARQHVERGERDAALSACAEALTKDPRSATALAYQALIHYDYGEYDQAEAICNQALDIEQQDLPALACRSMLFAQRGDFENALAVANTALSADSQSEWAQYALGFARFVEGKDFDSAASALSTAIALRPSFAWPYVTRAYAYTMSGQWAKALADASDLIRLVPERWYGYGFRSLVLYWQSHNDEALAAANEAVRLEPERPQGYIIRSYCWNALLDPDKALADADAAVRLNPQEVEAYLARSAAALSLSRPDDAISDANQALRISPRVSNAYYIRGLALQQKRQYNEAYEEFQSALKLQPSNIQSLMARGRCYVYVGKAELALADYDEAVRLVPAHPQVYLARAWALHDLGRLEPARTDAFMALRLQPTSAEARDLLGRIELKARKWASAVEEFTKAIEIDPSKAASSFSHRAAAYLEAQDFDAALADLSECIRLKPDAAENYALRAKVYNRLGRWDDALTDLAEAIRLDPNESEYFTARVQLLRATGRIDVAVTEAQDLMSRTAPEKRSRFAEIVLKVLVAEAHGDQGQLVETLTKAIRSSPQQSFYYFLRGKALVQIGQLAQAKPDFEKALEIDPQCSSAHAALAVVAFRTGAFRKAIDEATAEIAVDAAGWESFYIRGSAYIERAEWDKAIEDLDRSIKQGSTIPDPYLRRGLALREKGRMLDALADFDEYIRRDPKLADAHFLRALGHATRGDLETAVADFSSAIELNPKSWGSRLGRATALERLSQPERAMSDREVLTKLQEEESGRDREVILFRITPGSSAETIGLKGHDIVVEYACVPIRHDYEFNCLRYFPVTSGDEIVVRRDGTLVRLLVSSGGIRGLGVIDQNAPSASRPESR